MKFDEAWLVDKTQLVNNEIKTLGNQVNVETFNSFVHKITASNQPIYFLGVGSSFNLARKAAHSLCTIGIQALAPDLLDLLHGSIGGIRKSSLIVLISKSGRTPEILTFLQYRKAFGDDIYLITESDIESPLLSNEQIFRLPLSQELDLTGTLPTVSFMKMSILLDLILIAVQNIKLSIGTSVEIFHPGGEIGKIERLTLSQYLASLDSRPTIDITSTLSDCLSAISEGGVGGVSVIDGDMRLVGVISDGDIRRALLANKDIKTIDSITKFVQSSPEMLFAEDLLIEVRARIKTASRRAFYPVTSAEGRFLGTISPEEIFALPNIEES
jgi:arabinose-5-phosphate isomerase